MNEIKTYDVPETSVLNGELVVPHYDEAVAFAKEYIAQFDIEHLVVDETNYKEMKKQATNFNKLKEAISRSRIDCVEDFTANYQTNMKALSGLFEEARADLLEKITEYEMTIKASEPVRPKLKKFVVKFYDSKEVEGLKKYCEEHKLGWEIKE